MARKLHTLGSLSDRKQIQKARTRADRTIRAKKLARLLQGFKVPAARWK